ncbi:MAG: excinuclease ABC subunit UvrC [Desulfobacterales bacterium]|nr:excinuclease ABC subunit UvrC [Desulfobacterales bacterium]MDX2510821.1 excinuclease ABC subunit UvrC [Desulfobacterales bacterium]
MTDQLSAKSEIQKQLSRTPSEPGVYLFKDMEGKIIYVGKAAQLKKRLASYFSKSKHSDTKISVLVSRVTAFDVILVGSEKEALILESNLIKKYRPRYNVILKDDKRYPCLRINTRHSYPKISIVRKIKKDGTLFFGPFTSAGAVRQSLKIVNRTFKLRKCSDREFSQRTRPCLHYQMQRCLAPCCMDVDPKTYGALIQEVVLFLNGRTPDLIMKIKKEMNQQAELEQYEKAAELRDKIFSLEKILEKQLSVSTDLRDRDVIALVTSSDHAMIAMLYVRGGFLLGKRQFVFEKVLAAEEDILAGFLRQFYEQAHMIPPEILVSHYLEDVEIIEGILKDSRDGKVKIHRPQRGEKRRLVKMALENAENGLREALASNTADMALLTRLKKRLNMARVPLRIECFDNSHIFGRASVSGMVVFEKSRPKKAAYRTYRLTTAARHDDYAAMAEVLGRRYGKHGSREPLPDLLVVDGGKGQLNIAGDIIHLLGLEKCFEIIGIAKRDEKKGEVRDKIYQMGRANPVSFGRDLDVLLLLQKIRDEAHRFAIQYHRKLRGKQSMHSALDDISGVGPKRKAMLLKHFGSVASVGSADLKTLTALPGMNRKIARALKVGLGKQDTEVRIQDTGDRSQNKE